MPKKRSMTRDQEKAMWAKLAPRTQAALTMVKQGRSFYHQAPKRLYKLDPDHDKSFHVGSKKAALDRYRYRTKQRATWLHEVKLPKDAKILFAKDKNVTWQARHDPAYVLSDDDANWRVGDYARQMFRKNDWRKYPTLKNKDRAWEHRLHKEKLRKRLRERGFDAVAYYNGIEDPGSVSFIVLNTDRVRVRPVARKQYGQLVNIKKKKKF